MIRLAYSFCNRLLADAIGMALKKSGNFRLFPLEPGSAITEACINSEADILFMDVAQVPDGDLKERAEVCRSIRANMPKCKLALLVDENSQPEAAHQVMLMKQSGQIDVFFHSSVTTAYLEAALEAL